MSDIQDVGIGLRLAHLQTILSSPKHVNWFEVIADNFMHPDGAHLKKLERIRSDYPITFHCVGMNIGSIDPLNDLYLEKLRQLVRRFDPAYVSDHLSWIGCDKTFHHDLLPLPLTEETLAHVCARIHFLQEIFDRPFIVENVSSYLRFHFSTMHEWEFLRELTTATGCKLLLDVNNVYVSAINQGFDPKHFLANIPKDAVAQYHVAGYTPLPEGLIDSHANSVSPQVKNLLSEAQERFGAQPICLEWDNDLPSYEVLVNEALRFRNTASKGGQIHAPL